MEKPLTRRWPSAEEVTTLELVRPMGSHSTVQLCLGQQGWVELLDMELAMFGLPGLFP